MIAHAPAGGQDTPPGNCEPAPATSADSGAPNVPAFMLTAGVWLVCAAASKRSAINSHVALVPWQDTPAGTVPASAPGMGRTRKCPA